MPVASRSSGCRRETLGSGIRYAAELFCREAIKAARIDVLTVRDVINVAGTRVAGYLFKAAARITGCEALQFTLGFTRAHLTELGDTMGAWRDLNEVRGSRMRSRLLFLPGNGEFVLDSVRTRSAVVLRFIFSRSLER